MVRIPGLVLALGFLAVSPCLPDVMNVSVNGSINATGTVGYVCSVALPCIGDVTASSSFTLTGTNTGLGIFSRSGATSATDPVFSLTDSLSVLAQQSSTVTTVPPGELIQLDITNIETPGGDLGGGAFSRTSFWSASVNNDISAAFTLTTESVAILNGASESGFSAELLDSAKNPVFVFPTGGTVSPVRITLEVGTYQLVDDFAGGGGGFGFNGDSPAVQANQVSALIEAVPEPRWLSAPLVLLAALGCFVYRRRGTPATPPSTL